MRADSSRAEQEAQNGHVQEEMASSLNITLWENPDRWNLPGSSSIGGGCSYN